MIELNERERQLLMQCINVAIKSSQNAIEAAMNLTPIAEKLAKASVDEAEKNDQQ